MKNMYAKQGIAPGDNIIQDDSQAAVQAGIGPGGGKGLPNIK
jgi:hypothetical protein